MSEDIQYKLRLPSQLHGQMAELAKQNSRSLNAEIVSRLEQTLKGDSSSALIVDQANQIWELRQQILSDHLAMTGALQALMETEDKHEQVTASLRAAIGDTRNEAAAAIKRISSELALRHGENGLLIGNDLFERFSQTHEELTRKK